MAGIQLTGLATGMDTTAIVSQLMAAERAPRTKIEYSQALTQARRSNLADLQTKLNTLKLAAHDLSSIGSWGETQDVESADTAKVGVKRTSGVGPGSYEIGVQNLASAARRDYAFTADATAEQTISITGSAQGATPTPFTLPAGGTLDDLVSMINGKPEAGVYAVNVDNALVLSARTTGQASSFSVSGLGTPTTSIDGEDATFTVNGTTKHSATNVVANAIPGLELTLKGKTTSTDVNVGNPGPDTDVVKTKLKSFVSAYNDVLKTMNTDLAEKRVVNPTSSTQAAQGSLFGDNGLRDIVDRLRNAVSAPVDGFGATTTTSAITMLSQLGISTGAANAGQTADSDAVAGMLTFDESAFDSALAKDPIGVQKLLGGVLGTSGFGQGFESLVGSFSQTGGVLAQRLTSVDSQLSDIKDSLTRFDTRMDTLQSFYEKQFQALETAMAKSQSAGAQLSAQLNALS